MKLRGRAKQRIEDAEVTHQRELLRKRVHGEAVRITCWCCGVSAWVERATPAVKRTGLDGSVLTYATCDSCAPLERAGTLDRSVLAARLGIDSTAEVLDELRVPRFADELGARPERCNAVSWGHLTDRELARMVEDERQRLSATTTSPCTFCGDVSKTEGFGRNDAGMCVSCDEHFERRFGEARRDYAAGRLMGMESGGPLGLGRQVGLVFWHELPAAQRRGGRGPFAWITRERVEGWCRSAGLTTHRVFLYPW